MPKVQCDSRDDEGWGYRHESCGSAVFGKGRKDC